MTEVIVADTPGKLVLVGEYAVLEGAPAIAASVDVRASVSLETRNNADSRLEIVNDKSTFDFRLDPSGDIHWIDCEPGDRGTLLEATTTTLGRAGLLPSEPPGLRLRVDSGAFYRTVAGCVPEKLGLGSSAAVTVALTGALLSLGGSSSLTRRGLLDLCLQVHRRFQGQLGSGLDVACSLMGGVIELIPGERPAAESIGWPEGLHAIPVWSGASASTMELVGRSNGFRDQRPDSYAAHMRGLGDVSKAAVENWRSCDIDGLLDDIQRFSCLLRSYDSESGVGIFSGPHSTLLGISETHGAIYKPAGAGGGDFGIAFSSTEGVVASLRSAFIHAGFEPLGAEIGVEGLRRVRDFAG